MFLLRIPLMYKAHVKNYITKQISVKRYSTAIIKSNYEDIEIPNQSITQLVWSQSKNWDDLPVATCGVSERSYTYATAKMIYKRTAMGLLQRVGLKPGDVIGLLLPNIPEYILAAHASMEAGLIATFANPLHTADELKRQFVHAEVKCIVTIPLFVETVVNLSKILLDYKFTITIGGQSDIDRNILDIQEILAEDYDITLPSIKSSDIAVLPYSSGTTGLPKGVLLTHKNLVANVVQTSHSDIMGLTQSSEDDQRTVLTVLPFFHIMGFNSIMNVMIFQGLHIVTIPKFIPADYMQSLVKYKPFCIFVVPSLLAFIATNPEVKSEHLVSIKRIVTGAAPASKALIEKLMKKLNRDDFTIEQGYGMTETSPLILYTPHTISNSKTGSCGTLVASTQARLIDLKNGDNVTTSYTPGEILIKGPQVMKGYLNDPIATSQTIDEEGWLHTGDVAYYDDDKFFYITTRTKELIKVKGHQVSPTELESLILEIPDVADVAVVGVPDSFNGEVPKAFVVKKPNANINAQTIHDYIKPKVAAYKQLAGGIYFIEAIPRNMTGKILRNQLQNMED